jgi:hypothetical protein
METLGGDWARLIPAPMRGFNNLGPDNVGINHESNQTDNR